MISVHPVYTAKKKRTLKNVDYKGMFYSALLEARTPQFRHYEYLNGGRYTSETWRNIRIHQTVWKFRILVIKLSDEMMLKKNIFIKSRNFRDCFLAEFSI